MKRFRGELVAEREGVMGKGRRKRTAETGEEKKTKKHMAKIDKGKHFDKRTAKGKTR